MSTTKTNVFDEINEKDKWTVAKILDSDSPALKMDNGYFGAYSLIKYKGKYGVVYIDDRNALVKVRTEPMDKIFYNCGSNTTWSGDTRWSTNYPLVVYVKRKGYNLYIKGYLCDKWLKDIKPGWKYQQGFGDYLEATTKDGNKVCITKNGNIIAKECTNPEYIRQQMDIVKQYTYDEIMSKWINEDKPCYHIYGFEYKGARAGRVTKEEAIEMFKSHHTFNTMFASAEWRILNGEIALLMCDYSGSDYD